MAAKRRETTRRQMAGASAGPSVDVSGTPVIDPTENVIALVEAAHKRQDDLRVETNRRVDAEVNHLRLTVELQARHEKEIRDLESRRLDAIRQVDVTAVKTEADRALAAIQALAVTTAANAENLRTALQNTAQTIAKQTSDTVQQITERIAALEKSSYEGAGKSQVADPQIEALVREMTAVRSAQSGFTGERRGIGQSWGVILGVVGLISMLISIGTAVVIASRPTTAPSVQQPLYVPVPQGSLAPQPATPPR